jgi:hypothetical protein
MTYSLIWTGTPSPTNGTEAVLSPPISVPLIAVEITNLSQKTGWIWAGSLDAIYADISGDVSGRSITVPFGTRKEVRLEIPGYPYRIRFRPKKWVFLWNLKLYEKSVGAYAGTPSVLPGDPGSTTQAPGWITW